MTLLPSNLAPKTQTHSVSHQASSALMLNEAGRERKGKVAGVHQQHFTGCHPGQALNEFGNFTSQRTSSFPATTVKYGGEQSHKQLLKSDAAQEETEENEVYLFVFCHIFSLTVASSLSNSAQFLRPPLACSRATVEAFCFKIYFELAA